MYSRKMLVAFGLSASAGAFTPPVALANGVKAPALKAKANAAPRRAPTVRKPPRLSVLVCRCWHMRRDLGLCPHRLAAKADAGVLLARGAACLRAPMARDL